MDLSVTKTPSGDRLVVHVAGEIDLSTAPKLRAELTRSIEEGHRQIVLDIIDVPFLDSTGLGVLVGRLKALRLEDGDMVLVTDQDRTLRNFHITGLDKVFRIFPTVEEALRADSSPAVSSR
ncbi:anti-sigma factor antagonist [Calidifontibacter terrae]